MAGHSFDTKAEHNRLSYIFEETNDLSLVGEYFAWNLGTRVTEHNHQDTIGHFAYQELDGQWTANGQTLSDILNPPQEMIDQIENYQPVSDQFKLGLHAVEREMIGDQGVKQAVFVSPITNDNMGQYSVIYYFTRDEHDQTKINVNPITFRGTDTELQTVLSTLSRDTPSLEGTLSFDTPAFVRTNDLISKMDLFDAIRKTLEPSASRETKEYLARLETDLSLYDQLEALQTHRIEYLKALTLEYLREGLKDGTFLQRLRDLADGAPDLAEWLSKQENLDPTFYEKPVKAPLFNVQLEKTIEKENLPIFIIGWGDVARKEAAATIGIEKGQDMPPPRYLEAHLQTSQPISFRNIDPVNAPLQRIAQDIYRSIVPDNQLQPYPVSRSRDEVPIWLREHEDLLRRARHQAFLESLITKHSSGNIKLDSSIQKAKAEGSENLGQLFGVKNQHLAAITPTTFQAIQSDRRMPLVDHRVINQGVSTVSGAATSAASVKNDTNIFVKDREPTRRVSAPPKYSSRKVTPRRREESFNRRDRIIHVRTKDSNFIEKRDPIPLIAAFVKFKSFIVKLTTSVPIRKNIAWLKEGINRFIYRFQPRTRFPYWGFNGREMIGEAPTLIRNKPVLLSSLYLSARQLASRVSKIIATSMGRWQIEIPLSRKLSINTPLNVPFTFSSIKVSQAYMPHSETSIKVNNTSRLETSTVQQKHQIIKEEMQKQMTQDSAKRPRNQKDSLSIKNTKSTSSYKESAERLVFRAIQESRFSVKAANTQESTLKTINEAQISLRGILTKLITGTSESNRERLPMFLSNAVIAGRKLEVLTMLQEEARSREMDFFEFLSQSRVRTFKKSKYYLESLIIALMEALGISELDQLEILRTIGVTDNDARQISELLKGAMELHAKHEKTAVSLDPNLLSTF